ncbi:MAG: hypothetical protein K8L99_35200 [Anaerolineae bacterium]|nr:hypothetical protein [Anaerolineae bacterium]
MDTNWYTAQLIYHGRVEEATRKQQHRVSTWQLYSQPKSRTWQRVWKTVKRLSAVPRRPARRSVPRHA